MYFTEDMRFKDDPEDGKQLKLACVGIWTPKLKKILPDRHMENILPQQQLRKYKRVFSKNLFQLGHVREEVVPPFRIPTVPHTPRQMREPKVAAGQLEKLIAFLKEKLDAGLCEPGIGAYASRWFVMIKIDVDIQVKG
jgi:hypothetical protein